MVRTPLRPRNSKLTSRIVSVIVAGVALMLLNACGNDGSDEAAEPRASAETSAAPEESEAPTEQAGPTEFEIPEGAPANFPDINIPFFTPAELVASPDHGGDPFVLEFITNAKVAEVEAFFEAHVNEAGGWAEVNSFEEGDMTITEASKDGYSMVVAIGPERVEQVKTSIIYTIRAT